MESVAIRIDNVSKVFQHQVKGPVYAARDVSLDVGAGEFVTLLGPSGCGKTTILRMIAGFGLPDLGKVFIGGQDVTTLPANQRNIGFVFQNYALFPHLTIFENVAYGLRVQRQDERSLTRDVEEVLALVGLRQYGRQQPHQLSGGEQQRVALARAIVFRPKVLLFDEPLSNLDAKLRVEMRQEIRRLQKQIGITTVYVTHDQEEAMAISDRIAVMERGVVVQHGSAEDLYFRPASEFVARFIGRANLVSAKVLSGAEIVVEGLRIALATGRAPGETVRLVVRPEMIDIAPALVGQAGVATVVQRTFLGEKTDYELQLGGTRLQVSLSRPFLGGAPGNGELVSVTFDPSRIHVLS